MSKRGATILVVDDEQEIVRALKRGLTAHGYTVVAASSGEQAIEAVSQYRPDLLLLDLLLPTSVGWKYVGRYERTRIFPSLCFRSKIQSAIKLRRSIWGLMIMLPNPSA